MDHGVYKVTLLQHDLYQRLVYTSFNCVKFMACVQMAIHIVNFSPSCRHGANLRSC